MIRFKSNLPLSTRGCCVCIGIVGIFIAVGLLNQGEFTYNERYGSDVVIRRSESPIRFWAAIATCGGIGVATILYTLQMPPFLRPLFSRFPRFWVPGDGAKPATLHPLFLLFIGVLFLTPGLLFTSQLTQRFHRAWKLRNAVEVSANLLNVEQEKPRRSRRGTRRWPSISATYKFSHAGRTYVSDDVALFVYGGTFAELQSAFKRGEPVRCYVDPDDPSLSVLDKEFNLGFLLTITLFARTFTAVGTGISSVGVRTAASLLRATSPQDRHPPSGCSGQT